MWLVTTSVSTFSDRLWELLERLLEAARDPAEVPDEAESVVMVVTLSCV